MITIIDSDRKENLEDIESRYPGHKILLRDIYDDCNGNITGVVYAVSSCIDSYDKLVDLSWELYDNGYDAVIVGYYEEAFINGQCEYKPN